MAMEMGEKSWSGGRLPALEAFDRGSPNPLGNMLGVLADEGRAGPRDSDGGRGMAAAAGDSSLKFFFLNFFELFDVPERKLQLLTNFRDGLSGTGGVAGRLPSGDVKGGVQRPFDSLKDFSSAEETDAAS
jgi:hypothetical protein